jgi:hypothetical protein
MTVDEPVFFAFSFFLLIFFGATGDTAGVGEQDGEAVWGHCP